MGSRLPHSVEVVSVVSYQHAETPRSGTGGTRQHWWHQAAPSGTGGTRPTPQEGRAGGTDRSRAGKGRATERSAHADQRDGPAFSPLSSLPHSRAWVQVAPCDLQALGHSPERRNVKGETPDSPRQVLSVDQGRARLTRGGCGVRPAAVTTSGSRRVALPQPCLGRDDDSCSPSHAERANAI